MSIDDQNEDNLFMITMRQLICSIYTFVQLQYLPHGILWQNSLLVLHHQKLPMQTLSVQAAGRQHNHYDDFIGHSKQGKLTLNEARSYH